MLSEVESTLTSCVHCGDECTTNSSEDLSFCCNGCEQVYMLLHDSDLATYYTLENYPGISSRNKQEKDFEFLDEPTTVERLVSYQDSSITKLHFTLPSIHCSSCLWLLENLHRLNSGIISCKVNFLEKTAYINIENKEITLKELVILLSKIGYEPELNFGKLSTTKPENKDRSIFMKIGVAGFAFGNIMLLSFPEYLGFHEAYKSYFLGYVNLALAIPVLFYSGFDYLKNAYTDLSQGHLGIHVPLAIGMITLFARSTYEIISGMGEGYLDSFAGFVLFLLVGQWFKEKTQKHINFDRDYKSYFPISVLSLINGEWISKTIDNLSPGETIKIKNQEIIPCDGILLSTQANVDYSFVTGESEPKNVHKDEKIYAGGKQVGPPIEVMISKKVEQGYLTQLWNENIFKEERDSSAEVLLNKISKYFTLCILAIAAVTFIYWAGKDLSTAYRSITAVLIVACPCALAISVPFLLGSAMQLLSSIDFHVRSTGTIEKLADIDTFVFDKTGTITENESMLATYSGQDLETSAKIVITSLASQSSHPLSKAIARTYDVETKEVVDFNEKVGHGIRGLCMNKVVRIGSEKYILNTELNSSSKVLVEVDGKVLGGFDFTKKLRTNIRTILSDLGEHKLALLSGDNNREQELMEEIFPAGSELKFNQTPRQKLEYIQEQQEQGRNVLMIGDGLNDAGALKQSDVGIVIVENNNAFTPACDAIISAKSLESFISIQAYFKDLKWALYGAFMIAFLYNIIGLYFAVTGNLSPLVAAILMPLSSITIILYSLLISTLLSTKIKDSSASSAEVKVA